MDIEPRLLRYFLAVARELHFGRAAAALYVSQPALSEGLKRLETDLGVSLFTRRSRRVELTEAGQAMLAQAPAILQQVERAIAAVRDAGYNEAKHLRIGYSPFIDLVSVWRLRTRLQEDASLKAEFMSAKTVDQIESLLRGELLAGLVIGPIANPGLRSTSIHREPFLIGLPEAHPLASRKSVTLNDVRNESLVWLPRSFHPWFYDRFIETCAAHGYRPKIAHEVTTLQECIHLIGQAQGITFTTKSSQSLAPPGVVFRELKHEDLYVETLVTFSANSKLHVLEPLIEMARWAFAAP